VSLPLFPFPLSLFSSPALHHINTRTTTYSLATHTHTTHHTQTTHKGTPLPLPFSLFPFVCGVGVVRGMSMGCEWMCCGAGCGVVRVPFPPLLLFSLSFFSWWVCAWVCWVCVSVLGVRGVCGCVGLGVLIDVAAPQRGDQVKQVFFIKKDLAKTATKNLLINFI